MPRIKIKDWEIVRRWNTERPEFFNKANKVGKTIVAVSGLMALVHGLIPISIILAPIGGVISVMSRFPEKGISEKEAKELVEKLNQAKLELEKLKTSLN